MEFQDYLDKIYRENFIFKNKLIFLDFLCDEKRVEILAYPIKPENIDNNNIIDYGYDEIDDACNYEKKILPIEQHICNNLCEYIYKFEDEEILDFYDISEGPKRILFQPRKCFNKENMSYVIYIYK